MNFLAPFLAFKLSVQWDVSNDGEIVCISALMSCWEGGKGKFKVAKHRKEIGQQQSTAG